MVQKLPTSRTIIGLEIHVQLKTRSKMFCACPVEYDAPPNSRVCPVCLGHPGALPVLNRVAIEHSILAGLALGCQIASLTKWDRKSYYYPDLPKNYQISQYDMPIAENGHLEISTEQGLKRIRIRRAHLEEDAGKNIHDVPGCTLVDLNRTGTPLLEIVTEPDLASADEAYTFATELQRIMVYLGVSDANMQQGQMRFEPNINVAIEDNGCEYRTPISEVKNLNSFRALRGAIAYESQRQTAAWADDHDYLIGKKPNENRGWNDQTERTEFQRSKEAAHDYRYFPDPDLVPVEIDEAWLEEVRSRLPELPFARRGRFESQYHLSAKDAKTIAGHRATADLFEEAVENGGPADIVAKQLVNVWLKLANDRSLAITELGVEATRMAELAKLVGNGIVNKTAANQLAFEMLSQPEFPRALAEKLGLIQEQDTGKTEAWVDQALADNEQAVRDALSNPKKLIGAVGFLRGQVMKLSGGKADPRMVGSLIEERLEKLRANQ